MKNDRGASPVANSRWPEPSSHRNEFPAGDHRTTVACPLRHERELVKLPTLSRRGGTDGGAEVPQGPRSTAP